MDRRLIVPAIVLGALITAHAHARPQHGTAENGYYPMNYSGDTFAGTVTEEDNASRSITLTYTDPKGHKPETLTGSLSKDYTVRGEDGSLHQLKPSAIPIGLRLKVYYMTTKHKVNGKKVKTITIFEIAGLPNVEVHYFKFKAF